MDADSVAGAPVAAPAIPAPDLSRGDIADYLARSNYDPDKARALATHETLTNLGVHPAIAATVAAASAKPVVPAVPSSMIGAAPQVPSAASTQALVRPPVAPKPQLAAVASPTPPSKQIDLSAGFVPRASIAVAKPVAKGGKIDLSAGFVPQNAPQSQSPATAATPGATVTPNPSLPPNLADTSPMEDPGQGKTYDEPETKGVWHQIGGLFHGAGENIAGAVKGVHGMFQNAQTPEEEAIIANAGTGTPAGSGPLVGRLALAGYRFLKGTNDTLNQMDEAGRAGAKAKQQGEGIPGQLLADAEKEPFIGKGVTLAEQGEWGKSLGDILTSIALLRGGRTAAAELPEAAADAEAAIPKAPVVAGTTLPETVGQAASRVNPSGIGADIKGVEDVARKIPGSEGLRGISTKQQAAAREILANKARDVAQNADIEKAASTGVAPTATTGMSNAPESIEENAANAAERIKQAGSAKYEEIGKAARDADFSKPVAAAHEILSDDSLAKVLPKGSRDALGKVASALTGREEIAQQIYGKKFADLDPAKQGEVGKAMQGGASPSDPFTDILKARSELGSAANGARDAADARQLHIAHDQLGKAINESLTAHDAANGTDHVGALGEADKLWSQKYAFENFRDKLQDIMRDQPHTGNREINGAAFQKLVNDLDPRGAKGTTPLQRMFPDDAASVKDFHDLADFMGRNQGSAGGMASGMAKLRLLGLKESALGLIANTAGFSYILSKPGMARALLTAMSGGKDVAKLSAAVGEINNVAQQASPGQSDDRSNLPSDSTNPPTDLTTTPTQESAPNTTTTNSTKPAATSKPSSIAQQSTPDPSSGQGFQRPDMETHKMAGMKAAAEAPNTPEHLRPHLRKLAGVSLEKGASVVLPSGQRATVEYSAPDDKLPIVRVRTADGKVFRYTRQKDIDALKPIDDADTGPQSTTKYKFGNTQANIPKDSEAHSAIESVRSRISPSDLAGQGADVGGNHITVKYGIKGDDIDGIRKYIAGLAPFEAKLGKTKAFPPSESSDGAAVIHAPVEAPTLQKINAEMGKHGDFTEPSFKDYRPHATVAYVRPERASKYVGLKDTDGKKFTIDTIAISKKDGSQEMVRLAG